MRMTTNQIHPVDPKKIDVDGCIRHDDCGFHPSLPLFSAGDLSQFDQVARRYLKLPCKLT
jgi:hypothetical protein